MCSSSIMTKDKEFIHLKQLLETTAEKKQFNLLHPDVLAISRKLDQVIVRMMVSK